MRILFIKHHPTRANKHGIYARANNIFPPLGLVVLSTVLKQNDQNDVIEILDSRAQNLNLNQVKLKIKAFNPDIIGITAISETVPGVIEAGEMCKELFPNVLRIIGGPHIKVNPESVMKLGLFQLGVIGEGEITMLEIVNEYKKSKKIPINVIGTIVHNNGSIVKNESRPRIEDLDSVPIPDRHFLNNDLYGPYLAKKPWTYMVVL